MATISPTPKLQFLDANGNPLSYGLLYTYVGGTTAPLATYTTAAQTTANTNPIVLDSRGQADVWLLAGYTYKFVLQNASGVTQYTVDQVTAAGTMSTQNANSVAITGGSISGISLSGTITGDVVGNVTGNVVGNVTGSISGGTVSGSSYNGGQLAGNRNVIVNGDMSISQRGTSWTGVGAANAIYLDRWLYYNNTDGVVSIGSPANVPANTPFSRSMGVTVSTADTSIGASQVGYIQQTMANATNTLVGNTFTVSFWVRSSVAGTYSAVVRAFVSGLGTYRAQIKTYTISAADTWEYKTLTFINGLEFQDSLFQILFTLAAGSSYNTGVADVWADTGNVATSAQANFYATNGNVFRLTGVQIELGAVATPFEFLSPGLNEYLCQRDYQIIGQLGASDFQYRFYASGAGTYFFPVVWPTIMTTTPNVTIQGTWTTTNVSSFTAPSYTRRGCTLSIAATGAGDTTVINSGADAAIIAATGL